jgi:hypothetical protein
MKGIPRSTPIYVGLGDQDRAMIWLKKAYEARFSPSILLRPAFDSLRSDDRFKGASAPYWHAGMRLFSGSKPLLLSAAGRTFWGA